MSSLLILGIVQAIFFALVLLFQRKASLPSRILSIWMFILALNLGGVLATLEGLYQSRPYLFGFDATLIFLHGPMIYLYVITSISEKPTLKMKHLLHFAPYLFFTAYLFYLLKIENPNLSYEEIKAIFYDPNPILLFLEISIHAMFLTYIIVSSLTLRRYQSTIPKSFSYLEGIDFKWLQVVLYALLFISILIVLSIILSDILSIFSIESKAYLFYASMALLPFYLLFHAIQRKIIYPSDQLQQTKKYKNSTVTNEEALQIQKRLVELMKTEKPFLDGHLSILKLASMLDIHQKQLSQVINEKYQTNFFHFINSYRVEEVKHKINNPAYKNFSLLGIAYDSGFNTKSAFSKAFKRANGITPSEFKNLNK
ncbi:hypothetical protein DKG77_05795 [Flagellimonas aquimarina]|uniref:HTH araC/xylS-type domain-containing protein n=1 Tax=Flagellimonas aquimarina TaxID=2201895 RepID=A0A316L1E9_9FLAO|nr:helix-turn-helix domain-containing protein [Allomuricauda koreensis]PWL40332.1 hypothetical protein DKG77_05795 [Allomuricauda koreensis]